MALFLNVYTKSVRFVFVKKNLLSTVKKCFTDFREIWKWWKNACKEIL